MSNLDLDGRVDTKSARVALHPLLDNLGNLNHILGRNLEVELKSRTYFVALFGA